MTTDAAARDSATTSPALGLVARSTCVHVAIWIMVAVFGTTAILLSPFTRGQIVFWLGRLWGNIILWMSGVKLEVVGLERVLKNHPQVLVGNHTSNFDIYATIPALRDRYYRFLPKRELIYWPVLGWALWVGGFPFIDRGNSTKAHRTMNKLSVRMKRTGLSILAFPEGTRNCSDQLLLPFKKGPFVVAMEVGVPVLPFVLHGAREAQSRHAFIIHPGTIQVEFLEPIPVEGLGYQDRNQLVQKARGAIEAALLRGPIGKGTA